LADAAYREWLLSTSLIQEPQHWRERADQMLALADKATDTVAKETMLSIAAGYEHLAQRAEQRLAKKLALLWQTHSRCFPVFIHLRQCGHR
jgi:hypothetical protein